MMMNNALITHTFSPPPFVVYGRMTKRESIDADLAAAMRRLRLLSGKAMKELVGALNVTQQAVSRWENAQVNFPPDKIPVYLDAIGATQADLERMYSGLTEGGAEFKGPSAAQGLEGLETFEVTDESMSPWCEPGENVYFQRGKHPKRMEGVLVEFRDGRRLVRLWGRERDGHIFLHRVNPESTEQYLHSDITGFHRIAFRGG